MCLYVCKKLILFFFCAGLKKNHITTCTLRLLLSMVQYRTSTFILFLSEVRVLRQTWSKLSKQELNFHLSFRISANTVPATMALSASTMNPKRILIKVHTVLPKQIVSSPGKEESCFTVPGILYCKLLY
jgi:hypothetical protein